MKKQIYKESAWYMVCLARLFAVWGFIVFILLFIITLFFFIPCFFIRDKKLKLQWHKAVSKGLCFCSLHAIGCKYTIHQSFGKSLPSNQTFIFVCNHNSFIDILLLYPFSPCIIKFIAKDSLSKIPIFGSIYAIGSVLVNRKNDISRAKSFDNMCVAIYDGISLGIFPEGSRNKTEEPLLPFYTGAFRLAIKTNTPIVPVVIFNTKKILPANRVLYAWPHAISMYYLPPLYPPFVSMEKLKEQIHTQMKEFIIQHQ